jgi:phage terminase large subunit GpA-like protein
MLANGEWRATATSSNPKVTGYAISGLYRPHGWRSWGDIASDWTKAKRTRDSSLLRVLVNTDLGQTWDVTDGQSADPGTLLGRVEPEYTTGCPAGVLVVTAGIDVQEDRIELEIVGWGIEEESWSLDYRIIRGDTEQSEVWATLDEVLLRRIPHPLVAMGIAVSATCVDAGFRTQKVCEYTKARRSRRVFPVKGASSTEQAPRPIWGGRPTKSDRGKHDLFIVGVDSAKEALAARLAIETEGPGYCHFAKPHNDEAYFWQLTAEKLRTKYKNGRAIHYWWKPANRRNEALDCRVYAIAALKALLAMGMRLPVARRKAPRPAAEPGAAPNPDALPSTPTPRLVPRPPPRSPSPHPTAPKRPRSFW